MTDLDPVAAREDYDAAEAAALEAVMATNERAVLLRSLLAAEYDSARAHLATVNAAARAAIASEATGHGHAN